MVEKITKIKIGKSLRNGIVAGLVITILSFIVAMVPCIKGSSFGLCSLGNPFTNLLESSNKFYGISNNPLTGLIFQFIIPFVVVFLASIKLNKSTEKVVDYTKK
ncbi:hypothetical protein GOV12_06490 [Candidatus Pacearchaeota archaeon]|nr:hypothetical protein [Candidatus Pacearchaeota archaeon]